MNRLPPLEHADAVVRRVDSITELTARDAGAWVVSGSHGGRSAARYALAQPLALAVFNDAGVGKDGAGIAALDLMQAHGRAAATVAHDSARIGEAEDAWCHGVLSHVNATAAALGLRPGELLRPALAQALARAEARAERPGPSPGPPN